MPSHSQESWSDPAAWVELRRILTAARAELGDTGFVSPFATSTSLREGSAEVRRQTLEAAYRPHEEAVHEAMMWRLDTGGWPPLSPVQRHYASIILRYALIFVVHICPEVAPGRYSTIVPFPELAVEDVALYLVTRWWHDVGWMDFAEDFVRKTEPVA